MASPAGAVLERHDETRRIGSVVQETGVSKELVHHYIRQGLLPRPEARAHYTERQVGLLGLIRTLREDHNLPLEIIRRLFAIFGFDPARIESLTFSESLCKRITRFASDGDLLSHERLSAHDLADTAGISAERVQEYVQAGILSPLEEEGEDRFSVYDANVVSLCEHGVKIGIRFDSFRTLASYIRIAFDLEHAQFFDIPREAGHDAERILADFFIRREVANNFLQNVLNALTQLRLRELLERKRPQNVTLDDVVYRPSPAFVRRHGIDEQVEAARAALREAPDDPARWRRTASLLLHAGRYDEAGFFIEESLRRWPSDPSLQAALARVLILLGESERESERLARVSRAVTTPATSVLLALSQLKRASANESPEALMRDAAPILERVEEALRSARDAEEAVRVETTIFAGWLLTSLPPMFRGHARGQQLLAETLRELERDSPRSEPLPGLRERHLVNAAYLLFESLRRHPPAPAAERTTTSMPSPEDLRTLICRLDPGSAFAEAVFLAGAGASRHGRETP